MNHAVFLKLRGKKEKKILDEVWMAIWASNNLTCSFWFVFVIQLQGIHSPKKKNLGKGRDENKSTHIA